MTGVDVVSAGDSFVCALTSAGNGSSVYCWGSNANVSRRAVVSFRITQRRPHTFSLDVHRHICCRPCSCLCFVAHFPQTLLSTHLSHVCECVRPQNALGIGSSSVTSLASPPSFPILTGVSAISAASQGVCALVSGGLSCWGFYTSPFPHLYTQLNSPPDLLMYPLPSPSITASFSTDASVSPTMSVTPSDSASESATESAGPSPSYSSSPSPSASPYNGFTSLATGSNGATNCGISTYFGLSCWVSL